MHHLECRLVYVNWSFAYTLWHGFSMPWQGKLNQ
jgi:hypothetical protein